MFIHASAHTSIHTLAYLGIDTHFHAFSNKFYEYADTVLNHVLDLHPRHGCNFVNMCVSSLSHLPTIIRPFTRQRCVHQKTLRREKSNQTYPERKTR